MEKIEADRLATAVFMNQLISRCRVLQAQINYLDALPEGMRVTLGKVDVMLGLRLAELNELKIQVHTIKNSGTISYPLNF